MDPTSLVLFAIELFDIRKDREEAFECFVYVTSCVLIGAYDVDLFV